MRNGEIVEQPANQDTLTRRYTEEAVDFIRRSKDAPFFLYVPHSMPHVPLHCSDAFRGTSQGGLYGDVIEEINRSGTTILLVEQNDNMALRIASRAYVLETGGILLSGAGRELLGDPRVKEAYLGA